jgi:hypothetical protein
MSLRYGTTSRTARGSGFCASFAPGQDWALAGTSLLHWQAARTRRRALRCTRTLACGVVAARLALHRACYTCLMMWRPLSAPSHAGVPAGVRTKCWVRILAHADLVVGTTKCSKLSHYYTEVFRYQVLAPSVVAGAVADATAFKFVHTPVSSCQCVLRPAA